MTMQPNMQTVQNAIQATVLLRDWLEWTGGDPLFHLAIGTTPDEHDARCWRRLVEGEISGQMVLMCHHCGAVYLTGLPASSKEMSRVPARLIRACAEIWVGAQQAVELAA